MTKYDFLLRDVKFTIETDHKNPTYLKTAQSTKVRRWQLALQDYDFSCIHIAGADNVVADAFSRLCEHHHEDDARTSELHTLLLEGSADSPTEERLPVTTEPTILPLIQTQIKEVHNSVVGHFGVEYIRKALLSRGVNDKGLSRFVAKFVRDCSLCQLLSAMSRKIMTHRFTTASYTPMEVLNIDTTIGPVMRDATENCYIHVVIDCFTRFVELYPVSDASAFLCARALLNHVGRYGTPMTIRSDRGTQFVNGIVKELLDLLQ